MSARWGLFTVFGADWEHTLVLPYKNFFNLGVTVFQALVTRVDALIGFDRWGFETNPLLQPILRRETLSALRVVLWLVFGLGLLNTILLTRHILLSTRAELAPLETLLLLAGWGSYMLLPVMIAILTVITIRRLITERRFELMILMPLSNETIILGLIMTMIYRLRHVLLGLIGFMPVVVLPVFRWRIIESMSLYSAQRGTVYYTPDYWAVVGPTLTALLLVIALWGINLLGIAVGVGLALECEHPSVALCAAPLAILVIVINLCVFSFFLGFMFGNTAVLCALAYIVALAGMILIVPYELLRHSVYYIALRWRRRLSVSE
ncbi:MAG: hypothetical protein JXA10_18975 [Anaerolineae bacterium]|nr:hypothetical protein [Anaerolineae bacterium]